ncbi:TIGR02234 family membrane protein [Nocardia donostiensis]|uniref:TIGR02234 family membrane protein n=1 Tax=Nocardia donostiensis TaxID=1538463 RepID=UPI0020CA2ACF|nr:TIGR02234 family membrane protein [Nocardia donostiensis]
MTSSDAAPAPDPRRRHPERAEPMPPGPSASGEADPQDAQHADRVTPTAADSADDVAAAAPARRYPVGAIVLLAVAAAALWGASRLTWVTVMSSDGLTEPRTDHLGGGVWFAALTPLALVLLAAIAAVLATRGWLRRLVGVVVALVAAVTAVPALALLTGSGATAERAATLAELPGRAHVDEVVTANGPPVLTVVGALAAFAAGVLLARMSERTARLSGKYDNPVFRRAAATDLVTGRAAGPAGSAGANEPLSERVLWDALDAGTDPTDQNPENPGTAAGTGPTGPTGPTVEAGSIDEVDRPGSQKGGRETR